MPPPNTHAHAHALLTSWRAAASPLPGGAFPGLWRARGWGWWPDPGPGRAEGPSAAGHVGECRFCMSTQSGPTTLCSKTALAMYLKCNKPDAGGSGPPDLVPMPPQLKEHIAQGWALQGAGAPVSSRLQCPSTPFLGTRMHRGKDIERLLRLPHALKETSGEREQRV